MGERSEAGRARTSGAAFRMECGIEIGIDAPAERIWSLLTCAEDFPRWNSTVTALEGPIALGRTLALRVRASPRTFRPVVTELVPHHRMVWSQGNAPFFRGVRTFTLTPLGDGATRFAMGEVLRGLLLPLIRRSLPDFAPEFEDFARDLRQAAERGA